MADTLKPDPSRIARRLSSSTTGGEEVFEYDLIDYEPQPLPETEEVEYEEVIDYIDRTGEKVQVPVFDDNGKKIYRPTYNEQGVMTHDERGIMTFDEWKRKSEEGVDWWPIAKEAVAGLARGFTKIPGKIEKEGFMEASANIPESFLAATEGLKLIGGGVGRFVAKPFRTEEEEDAAEYAAYKEFGNQIFRQLELRKSRMGDVARLFGAEDLAAVYDDGIDPEIADSLSLIFDPTYLVGGGLVKVGAAAAKQAPKVTNKFAKKMIQTAGAAAGSKAAKQLGEFLAKPVTSTVSGIGTATEKVGRGVQKIGEAGAKFAEKAPKAAGAAQVAVGAGTGAVLAPEGQELTGALGGAFGGKYALSSKTVIGAGEKIEKNAQRLGGAAQASKINSLRTSGLGTVAKIRPMREEVAKQFVTLDNRVANRLLSEAGKLADTAAIGAGIGGGLGAFMPYDPTNPGYIAGMALGTLAAPAGMYSAAALNQLARVELAKGATPDAGLRLRLKETPMHKLASEAVVKRFISALPEQQRVRFVDPDRGLSVADLANQAEAVDLFMGAMRDKGKDVNFFIGNTPEILEKTGGTAREGVAGFYDPDSNTVFVNTDAETPSFTLFHELFHPTERWSAMRKELDVDTGETVKSDPLQDIQTDLAQTIFGTYGPDGEVIQPGLYSKKDMLSFADQYNSRLYPDLSAKIKEVEAAIEAEKKKTLPEIDGIEPPETPEMRLLNRELEELQTRQEDNQKELAAFDKLPDATKRNYMARELMSDYFAMFGESARHGIIRKARNITLKKDYFKDKFLGMNIDRLKMATLGNLRKLLEGAGVEFDLAGNPRGEMTATSALFKDRKTGRELVMSPQIEHLIAQYITEKDKLVNRVSETDDVGGSEITLNAKDVLKKNPDGTPKIPEAEIKRWASSGWLKTDKEGNVLNSTGGRWQPGQRPAFTTARERTRMEKNRVAALVTALTPVTEKIAEGDPGSLTVKARETADGGTNFRGSYFDEQQMDAIMATPDDVIHPDLKSVIKTMNDAIKEGKGAPFLADYWKAITGRGYDSKARMKVQLFTPIGMQISSAGNFNATVFNIGYFENKINRWLGQSGKKKFWSDWADADGRVDVDSFRTDMMELLKTHYENDPSKKFPEGMKKEKLYSFLGVKPEDLSRKDWNRAAKDFKLFISLRFDRMKDVTRGMGDNFPVNYYKAKQRFMPGEELTPGETGVRSPADGQRTTQRDIRSGSFRIDPPTGGAGFSAAISDAAARHKFGAAVEVKQPEFYVNPETKLFLDPDQSAGLAITPDRDLVSVFKKPESQANIRDILAEASPYASTLDAFDVGGFLPNLYAENGFRPVARVPWNAEYAPPNWPKEMGEPDVVLMVRDPDGVLKLPDADYNQMRDQVPLYNDYDAALAAQQAARARVDEVGVSDARFMPAGRARAGGEVGKNQDFYKGGQFLPSTEMPKREREKINRAASGKERIDVGYGSDKFAIPEVYKAPLVRDYSVFMNDEHLGYLEREGAAPEYIEKQREARRMWDAGDRFVDVREKPEFAKFQDVARIFKAGLPIPDQVVKALEASGNANIETIKKYSSRSEGGDARFMPAALQDSVEAQTNDRPSVGVNINDGQLPFSRWIVDGRQNEDGSIQKKTIETRANAQNNALAKLSKTGERFAIISTFGPKKKQAEIIATARAGSPIMYDTLEKFRADQDKHMVKPGSDFDWDGFKVGYPIEDVRKLEKPVPVPRNVRGIQTRDLSDVRYMPAERNDRKNRVSTRLPTAVAATEDPIASTLLIDSAAVFNLPPEKQKVMAQIIAKYPNIRTSSKNLQPVADELVQQAIDNLLWLHDKVPADIRKRSMLWYDGARKITNGYTREFQITNPAGAGVLAVLSPGKDWFMNVSLAERIIDTVQNKVGKPIDAKMMKQAKFRFEGNATLMNEVKKMVGKKYNNLTPFQKAIWIRMYDEAYNSPSYEVISPEGNKVGLVKKKDGTDSSVAHQSFPFIQKAISVLDDPSKENISKQLGTAHKIRNFYNNILLPKLAKEDVTIDTHAVAAALLRPLAQKSTEVQHGLGTDMPSSSITGAQGAYGIYADAYREAARQRGLLPRQMQSITWEAVRGLFPKNMKTKQNKALADAIWTDYKRGRKTIDEARKDIEKLFGGIDAPDWYR